MRSLCPHRLLLLTVLGLVLGLAAPVQALCMVAMAENVPSCHEPAPAPDADLNVCCDLSMATPAVVTAQTPLPMLSATAVVAMTTSPVLARQVVGGPLLLSAPPPVPLSSRLAFLAVFVI